MSTEDVSLHDEEGNLLFDGEANPDSLRAILFDLMHALTKKEFVVACYIMNLITSTDACEELKISAPTLTREKQKLMPKLIEYLSGLDHQ